MHTGITKAHHREISDHCRKKNSQNFPEGTRRPHAKGQESEKIQRLTIHWNLKKK